MSILPEMMLTAAQKYARQGWSVFPAPPNTKKSYKVSQPQRRQEVGEDPRSERDRAGLVALAGGEHRPADWR